MGNFTLEKEIEKEVVELKEKAPTLYDFLGLIDEPYAEDMEKTIQEKVNKILKDNVLMKREIEHVGNDKYNYHLKEMTKEELKEIIDTEENDYSRLDNIYLYMHYGYEPISIIKVVEDGIEERIYLNLEEHLNKYIEQKNPLIFELLEQTNSLCKTVSVVDFYEDYSEYTWGEAREQLNTWTDFNINWDEVLERLDIERM